MTTPVHLICCAYNCSDFLAECLQSIEEQDYPNLNVVVVDDASTDQTQRDLVRSLNTIAGMGNGEWTGVLQPERRGATYNIWYALNVVIKPDPDDLVVLVDGDDKLKGADAVSRIVAEFDADPDMWVGYGSYEPFPPDPMCEPASPYPPEVVRDRSFRSDNQRFNHPLCWRGFAWAALDEADMKDDSGEWVRQLYDSAIMLPLLEAVGPHHKCMTAATYLYRADNPDSCNRENAEEMHRVGAELRARPKKPRLHR